jgi:hypothetical protein
MPRFFLLSYKPFKCVPHTAKPALTCQALQIRPFLIKDTARVVSWNGVREFLFVEHTAHVRKNSKISAIWHHGGDVDTLMIVVWRGIGVAHTVKAVPQS